MLPRTSLSAVAVAVAVLALVSNAEAAFQYVIGQGTCTQICAAAQSSGLMANAGCTMDPLYDINAITCHDLFDAGTLGYSAISPQRHPGDPCPWNNGCSDDASTGTEPFTQSPCVLEGNQRLWYHRQKDTSCGSNPCTVSDGFLDCDGVSNSNWNRQLCACTVFSDSACPANSYGLDCGCATATTGSGVLIPVVGVSAVAQTNTLTFSVDSAGVGALEVSGRTTQRTEVTVETGDGSSTCVQTYNRDSFTCSDCTQGNVVCTTSVTTTALATACGAAIHTRTMPDGNTGFKVDIETFYEDTLYNVFGNVAGTAENSASAVVWVPVTTTTVKEASSTSVSTVSLGLKSSSITRSTGAADSTAEMDLALELTTGGGLTASSVVASVSSGNFAVVSSTLGTPSCSGSACTTAVNTQLSVDKANCDFNGEVTITVTLSDGSQAVFTVTVSGVTGTDACEEKIIDAGTFTATGTMSAPTVQGTGVLGLNSASTTWTWTSTAEVDSTTVTSTLTDVGMAVQATGTTCNKDTSTTTVYPGAVVLAAGDGSNLVSVSSTDTTSTIAFTASGDDLTQLANIDDGSAGSNGWSSLQSAYSAQICIVVSRTVSSFDLGRRLEQQVVSTALVRPDDLAAMARQLANSNAAAAGSAGLTLVPSNLDFATEGMLAFSVSADVTEISQEAEEAIETAVATELGASIGVHSSSVHVHSVKLTAGNAHARRLADTGSANGLEVAFTVIVATEDADAVAARLRDVLDEVAANPSTAILSTKLAARLTAHAATTHMRLKVVHGAVTSSTPREQSISSIPTPVFIGIAFAIAVVFTLAAVWCCRDSGAGKTIPVTDFKTGTLNPHLGNPAVVSTSATDIEGGSHSSNSINTSSDLVLTDFDAEQPQTASGTAASGSTEAWAATGNNKRKTGRYDASA